jgi:hypothetical protein
MKDRTTWRSLGHEPGDAVCVKLGRQAFGGTEPRPCGFHHRQATKQLRRERAYLLGQLGLPEHRRAPELRPETES